ncbi:MAG: CoA transferase [Alcaligenaceae bacterium]|nr:CoA transferase [Alcaligenaceae bacterium]
MTPKPYTNIHVVELGARIGASACGRLLADLGAKVYVVEPRSMPVGPTGKWLDRVSAVAGKESVLSEPSNDADVATIAKLIASCDVVIRSSDFGEKNWPESWREAVSQCPIVCDLTAFGSSGPLAGQYSEEVELQALTGIMHTTGMPTGAPLPVGIPIVEMSSGLYAASAIAVALHERARSGTGQHIEIALYDVAINTLTTFIAAHYAGREPQRLGNGHGMAVPWNTYPTSDGWILICTTNDAQWNRLVSLIGPAARCERYAELKSRLVYRNEVDGLVRQWTSAQSLDALEALLSKAGIPCGRIVNVADLADEPNLKMRATIAKAYDPVNGSNATVCSAIYRYLGEPPSQVGIPAPDSGRSTMPDLARRDGPPAQPGARQAGTLALHGVRVIEIGQLTTAPLAARHLATLGADVIKVEPIGGESARAWEPRRNGVSHFFIVSNGEKRAIEIDLRVDDDRRYFTELLADADILIENLKPGALARLGFGQEQLHKINPRLIYCAISGFGMRSAYPGRAAVDTVIQAMSGIMDTTRSEDTPVKAGISVADIAGGQTGLLSVIAALAQRRKTGKGCAIDISMQDVGAWMTQHRWNGANISQPAPSAISSIGSACEHAQTRARDLIQIREDEHGQAWEVLASPMRLSLTPPRLGRLMIGSPTRRRLRWRSLQAD